MPKENKNQNVNSNRRKILSAASLASAGALLSPLISKAAPATIIEAGSNVDTASYIIFKDGNTIYAKNGTTGKIEFSGIDAATIIQNTIDAASHSYGGGTVYLREGNYTISKKILYKPVNLIGSGQGKTVLIAANNLNDVIIEAYGYINSYYDYYRFGKISNLTIDGNRNNQTSGEGIVLARCQFTVLEHLNIQNVYNYGIKVLRCYWVNLNNIAMYDCGNGIRVGAYSSDGKYMPNGTPGDLFTSQNIFTNVRVEGGNWTGSSYPTQYGIYVASGDSNSFYNCDCSSCNEAIHLQTDAGADKVWRTNIFSHWFEDDGAHPELGINIVNAGTEGTRYTYIHAPVFAITGTHIQDNSGHYILIDTSSDTITGGQWAPNIDCYNLNVKGTTTGIPGV